MRAARGRQSLNIARHGDHQQANLDGSQAHPIDQYERRVGLLVSPPRYASAAPRAGHAAHVDALFEGEALARSLPCR